MLWKKSIMLLSNVRMLYYYLLVPSMDLMTTLLLGIKKILKLFYTISSKTLSYEMRVFVFSFL